MSSFLHQKSTTDKNICQYSKKQSKTSDTLKKITSLMMFDVKNAS